MSFQLAPTPAKHSTDYKFKDLKAPWVKSDAKQVDQAWRNPKTGNSLSVLSDCNDAHDPSLESIRDGTVTDIDAVKIISEKKLTFNQREALRTEATGSVDGVATHFQLMVFKKNGCTFIISYLGTETQYVKDVKTLETFLQEFEVP